MARKPPPHGIIITFFFFFIALQSAAQPTLPDISGSCKNEKVTLAWTCQYNGVRAISVLRSHDSLSNYSIIGYVKNTERGAQSYEDEHPPAGKNYYKLSIDFVSGLNWHSNLRGIEVPASGQEPSKPLPSPNSLPKPVNNSPEKTHDAWLEKDSDAFKPAGKWQDTCSKPEPKPRPSVSLSEDMTTKTMGIQPAITLAPTPKITLKSETQPDIGTPMIRSKLIFTDSLTGHVDMFLPEDVAMDHYSLKFYDMQNQLIIDLPKINSALIIFDKRNFQRKGVYKFVLRKDYTELEAGYIFVEP